ncbi:MAG: U32 family peptidase [Eggerthellaceae bacterium]|nr:U32 family peptidase [Eggerthellaceae bacterium]
MECLHAAVCAGADAVYLGLDEFNARRNAGNFTLESFAQACEYAHLRGVRLYVTLNVEILPSELDRALELARQAYEAGADAFIVQDIGLASELHRMYPQIPWHASTQMNIHSAAGVEAAAQLGASRVTLARELAVEEIAELCEVAAGFGMDIEVFAHGALCVCYSGQCLMSSMIGGRSANRGLCAQACRLPYELKNERSDNALPAEGEHLLSPRDLCTIDMLDELSRAGVGSLKIEGRMKSADYVHEVVSVYREVLDADGVANEGHRARLAEAFSRGFTTGYLEGMRGNEIMSYGRPNNRGVFVGRVVRAGDGFADVAAEAQMNSGDVLEFWTNRGHFAATVPASAMGGDGVVRVPVDQRVGKGDRVFRVRNAQTAFADDEYAPRIPVDGQVRLRLGEPAYVRFSTDGTCGAVSEGEAWGQPVQSARTREVSAKDVCDHVDRLGNTPFVLNDLAVDVQGGVGLGFSELHHLRAEALEALKANMLADYAGRSVEKVLLIQSKPSSNRKRTCDVVAWVTNPSCARAARKAGADVLYVPILNFRRGQAQLAGVRQDDPEQAGYPKQCVMALPAIDHDPVPSVREYDLPFDIWDYVREGKTVFADSMASCVRALSCGASVEVGPHVPATNAASLRELADLGVSRVWLSPELTLGQIDDLARTSSVSLGLTVIGSQELMVTEHCLLMSQGPCNQQCETCPRRAVSHKLVDRKGFEFPVVTDLLGRSHLYNGVQLDIVQNLPDLVDIGIDAIMVDATLMDKRGTSEAVGRVIRARDLAIKEHRALGKRPGTTTGHLFRGVS